MNELRKAGNHSIVTDLVNRFSSDDKTTDQWRLGKEKLRREYGVKSGLDCNCNNTKNHRSQSNMFYTIHFTAGLSDFRFLKKSHNMLLKRG